MSQEYFPLGSRSLRRFEHRFRRRLVNASPRTRMWAYWFITRVSPGLIPSEFQPNGEGLVRVRQNGHTLWFPDPIPLINHSHIAFGYIEHLRRKYSLPGFVEVSAGDVVVDCGAFIGGFALGIVDRAREVHLFDPAPGNIRAINANLCDRDSVIINEAGLYDRDDTLELNLSASAVEHSFLVPDDGAAIASHEVPVHRLDTYFSERDVTPDFVKIEAEGVEIEVFRGLGDLRPAKIAIDVSPERNQESPLEELTHLLHAQGYETRQRHHMLFARVEPA